MNTNEARQVIADDILKRIAARYAKCEVRIFPDCPELTPVEAVLRCAAEEGFVLSMVTTLDDHASEMKTVKAWWSELITREQLSHCFDQATQAGRFSREYCIDRILELLR